MEATGAATVQMVPMVGALNLLLSLMASVMCSNSKAGLAAVAALQAMKVAT